MILLARHGETDDNLPPIRVMGWRDVALNERGRAQAHQLAERARARSVASLYASPLRRARETAEIVGRALGLEPVMEDRLRESYRGRWEGRLFQDIAREEPEAYAAWRSAGERFRFPGGESLREHSERVACALREIAARAAQPALTVCHGGTIRVALCQRDPRGLAAFHVLDVPNAALIEL